MVRIHSISKKKKCVVHNSSFFFAHGLATKAAWQLQKFPGLIPEENTSNPDIFRHGCITEWLKSEL